MSLLQNSNAIETGGYPISNSLRFQSASSQYLSRTPASASNRQTWTWSGWVKRGDLANSQVLFSAYNNSSTSDADFFSIKFNTSGTLGCDTYSVDYRVSSAVYRDPSAWYHVVVTLDTTQATANNRIKMYVNGSEITSFTTTNNPTQNANSGINSTIQHRLGSVNLTTAPKYLDGYMAEVNFIDGQALTPSSFGETNTLTGQWVAKKYTGTYGTNGFYLPFSNGTSTTTLGYDSSGNGNNWTLNNFTRSAGVSDCWMYDVPSGNGGVAGTQPNSNYCVLNPLLENGWWAAPNRATFQRANLRISQQNATGFSTFDVNTNDKWYFEMTSTTNQSISQIVISAKSRSTFEVSYTANANKVVNGSSSAYGASWTNGDTIGVAVDRVNNQITFYKNGVSQGAITNTFPAIGVTVLAGYYSENTAVDTVDFNFGQRSFAYTPPSGFKALCTANLPVATIKQGNKYMTATAYTPPTNGNYTVTTTLDYATNGGLIWEKRRNGTATDHYLVDTVRGVSKYLSSNLTAAEATSATYITGVTSTGYTEGSTGWTTADNVVSWGWIAGGNTSSNTSGSITSTVSANTTAGFSIVTYTGTGANATVGHGLGVAPKWFFIKARGAAVNWTSYHEPLGNTAGLHLNTTGGSDVNSGFFNNTSPTSSTIAIGSGSTVNTNGGTYVAYCFAEIAGFSKFGSYTGNGSADGPMIFTGFKPKYIMIKCTNAISHWTIEDSARSPYNVATASLYADTSGSEITSVMSLDFLSNGFKCRNVLANESNVNGYTYIYMAFAENPFAQSNAV